MDRLNVKEANKLVMKIFLFMTVVALTFSFFIKENQFGTLNIYLFINEWVVIFLPAYFFARRQSGDFYTTFRVKPIKASTAMISVYIGLVGWVSAAIIQLFIFSIFFKNIKPPPGPLDYAPDSIVGLVLQLFIVAVSAGICEEFLFRGVVLRGYEEWGTLRAILFSGFLFALLHGSMLKLVPLMAVGALFSYMAVKFDSIFPSMIAHTTNNAASVIIVFLTSRVKNPTSIENIIIYIIVVLVLLAFLFGLPFLILYLRKLPQPNYHPPAESIGRNLISLLRMWTFYIIIGIAIYLMFSEWQAITTPLPK